MRVVRPLLSLSLPMALALSACTGAGTPDPSTGIDVGATASSSGPTATSSQAPSTAPSPTAEPALAWADGTAVEWGKPVSPQASTPKVAGTVAAVVPGSTPLPWGFAKDQVLSSQENPDSFDAGNNVFKNHPVLALGPRQLTTAKGTDGAEPGQVLGAAIDDHGVVWAQTPSAQAGFTPWTVYTSQPDGSAVKHILSSGDEHDVEFVPGHLVLTDDMAVFAVGSEADRQIVAAYRNADERVTVPAPGASDVWAAGGKDTVMWEQHEDGVIQIVKAVAAGELAMSWSVVLSVAAETTGEEPSTLRLLAASGNVALVAQGETVAVVNLKTNIVREVSGVKASSLDPSAAEAGGGRVAVPVAGGSGKGTRVLSVAPDGAVQLLTLPATEGGIAVDADQVAVTTTAGKLTVLAIG
jgi:hypothetical protein